MINDVLNLMISYNSPDIRRINHAIKVFSLALNIAENENCDKTIKEIIAYSSILHDIGIHMAEEKYNSSQGKFQEIEGPSVAKELLKELNIPQNIKDRVLYLIGHHHSYNKIDGLDFQILVEADFLVNIFEDSIERKSIENIRNNIFKTNSGISLLNKLYLY